jgi:putative glycerol-1-phosphate prenyltransferase
VAAAPILQKSCIETKSTGYILIDGGKTSSVEYMSNTKPIPADKIDLAVATCLAGEMLGMRLLYLEAGSGAPQPVPANLISAVKKQLQIPLIVGGGINTKERLQQAYAAGADIAVVGNALEKNTSLLKDFCAIRDSF